MQKTLWIGLVLALVSIGGCKQQDDTIDGTSLRISRRRGKIATMKKTMLLVSLLALFASALAGCHSDPHETHELTHAAPAR